MNLTHEVLQPAPSFFRPAKLSSDLVLSCVDTTVCIYSIPQEEKTPLKLESSKKLAEKVYDYTWVDSSNFLCLVKDHPVYLFDFLGNQKQKFKVTNHLEEVRSPMAVSPDCQNHCFYTALNAYLKVYDLETGLHYSYSLSSEHLHIRPRTILSAITHTHNHIAVGDYTGRVIIVDRNSNSTIAVLEGQSQGIIQCEFRNCMLYTGARKDNRVLAWDLRNPKEPLHSLSFMRIHNTQQRVLFDLDREGEELYVGNSDGSISCYSTSRAEMTGNWMCHFDAVNSVQVSEGLVCSSSGQRHIQLPDSEWLSMIRIWNK